MIAAERLTVGYGETVILEDLDFTVPEGDVFAILGGSGSGKSTLLRNLIVSWSTARPRPRSSDRRASGCCSSPGRCSAR
jgi:ABC-type transporter Mla maintaining outer membrane lipid asymmetry ATPase subunit MlaF